MIWNNLQVSAPVYMAYV